VEVAQSVIAELDPAIHQFKKMDRRVKPGDDIVPSRESSASSKPSIVRRRVIREVDLEHAGIELLAGVEIVTSTVVS